MLGVWIRGVSRCHIPQNALTSCIEDGLDHTAFKEGEVALAAAFKKVSPLWDGIKNPGEADFGVQTVMNFSELLYGGIGG